MSNTVKQALLERNKYCKYAKHWLHNWRVHDSRPQTTHVCGQPASKHRMEDELHVGGIELENYRTVHEVSQSLLVNNYWKHNNKKTD